jgi:hypothetical protein
MAPSEIRESGSKFDLKVNAGTLLNCFRNNSTDWQIAAAILQDNDREVGIHSGIVTGQMMKRIANARKKLYPARRGWAKDSIWSIQVPTSKNCLPSRLLLISSAHTMVEHGLGPSP